MKIVKLTSENVKRLSVVEITPDGSLITIGGKNGAGKSSVLDSIAYVLGGEKLVPTQPIRKGATEARIVVDLADFIVTRRFYRDLAVECGICGLAEDHPDHARHDAEAHLYSRKETFGPTKSVLTVTNREGAKYPAPQVLLDKLYGKLTFDPLAFSKEDPKKQDDILRRLVNLDFSILNSQRQAAFERRTMTKRTLAIAQTKLDQMPRHASVGLTEQPIADVLAEIKAAHALKVIADEALEAARLTLKAGDNFANELDAAQRLVLDLESRLQAAREEVVLLKAAVDANHQNAQNATIHAEKCVKAVPDFASLDDKLSKLDQANSHARQNQAYAAQEQEVGRLAKEAETETGRIEEIDSQKSEALSRAQFPVPGLGLSDDGVTFEGLPLSEVSASIQLRVSIAIGLALNPTLKVLLIRNGNLLDDDSVKLVAAQAEEAGAQVWMEYVTSSADGVSVMLEDGHVAQ